jgi:Zn-dependent protease
LGGCASLIALPRKAWQELLTALAGPLVSLALAGILNVFEVRVENIWLRSVLYNACSMNMMLGIFNLMPGFPLDGGRIFRSVMRAFVTRAKATYIAMVVGRGVAILLGLWGLYMIFTGGNWGFIYILIAWMIWREGWREYQLALAEERFDRWTQDDFNARVSPPPYDR